VVWEGKPSTDGGQLTVTTSPVNAAFLPVAAAQVGANYQFTLERLLHQADVFWPDGGERRCNRRHERYQSWLEITISARGARAHGAVTDKDGLPAAGVWVVAVPDEARRTLLRLFKAQTTDQYGKFDLHGLAPGDYKLFAWDEVEEPAWEDGEFLRPFEARGTKIEVRDEDSATLNLKVISGNGDGNN